MFSDNSRISARQAVQLWRLEWMAGPVLLFPVILSGMSIGSMLICMILGIVLWTGIMKCVLCAWDLKKPFLKQLTEVAGKPFALLFCTVVFLYFLVQASVFTSLTASLTKQYLLPEESYPLLCLLPIAAGIYLAYGSQEIRGRFGEVTGPVVTGLILFLLFLSVFGTNLNVQNDTTVRLGAHLLQGSFEVFAVMGGMFVPVLAGTFVMKNSGYGSVKKAGIFSGIAAGALCVTAAIRYGENGMQVIGFPTIRVMSSRSMPGAFWQRWDLVFLALLILCLTVTVSGALWYVREMLAVFLKSLCKQEKQERYQYPIWYGCCLLVYFAAAGFLNGFTALCYYRAMNIQILVPFLLILYTIMLIRKRTDSSEIKRYRARKMEVLLLLLFLAAAVFFLTGCSARDPEERLFPTALEIGLEDGLLAVTYAWNEELGPTGTNVTDSEKQKTLLTESVVHEDELTTLRGNSLQEIRNLETLFTERYLDYSHVKAMILRESLSENPGIEQEVMEWFAKETAFSSGLIVYPAKKGDPGLKEAGQHAPGQVGEYLENLYKNSGSYQKKAVTLATVIALYYD